MEHGEEEKTPPMKKQKKLLHPLPLSSALLACGLIVSVSALALRLFIATPPSVSATETFDTHYVSRLLTDGALGHFGPPRTESGVEGVVAAPAEVGLVGQAPVLLMLAPGRSVTLTLTLQNQSRKPWSATGSSALRLRLKTGSSGALRHRWWKGSEVARLKQPVAPKGTAVFRIPVTGPQESRISEETFELYQGKRRVPGGTFTVTAVVGTSDTPNLAATVGETTTLTLLPGAEQRLTVTATNTGRLPWKNKGWGRVRLVPKGAPNDPRQFRSASWAAADIVSVLPVAVLNPGESTTLTLPVKAPLTPGTYTEEYVLAATGIGAIPGGTVPVTITVQPDQAPLLDQEPAVRVGIFSQGKNPSVEIRPNGFAKLATTDGTILLEPVTFVHINKEGIKYRWLSGDATGLTDLPIRVEAPATTVLTLEGWVNKPGGSTTNYNAYRGTLEFRTTSSGQTWVINELPVESYLAGLAETSASSPLEFRKTLLTAARTYALYHNAKKTKHAADNFDLNATTDQVYRGYNREAKDPSVREAAEATRGMVFFHPAARAENNPNGIALAAYSACTDGRTRSFQEAFGGDGTRTPYLVSVPDPDGICINARYRQGLDGNHMVGISGSGGIAAARAGKRYDEILAYYYTGILLTKYYD